MRILKQSTARDIDVLMVDSTDHVTGKTGLTLTIKSSKAGAAFATITPTVTELENGHYKIALTSGHTDTLGDLILKITATGADQSDVPNQVIAADLFDGVRMGLTALPNAAAEAAGGLVTRGTGTGQVNVSGGRADANVTYFGGAAGTFAGGKPDVGAAASVTGSVGSVAAAGIAAASFAVDAVNASALAADAVSEIAAAVAAPSASTIATAVWASGTRTLTSFGTLAADTAAAVWVVATSGLTVVGSIGKLLVDNINATISSRATPAQVNTEADQALADVGLTSTITSRIDVALSSLSTSAALASVASNVSAALVGIAAVNADTDDIQTRIPTSLVGGRMDSSMGAVAAGAINAAAIATDAVDADALAADAVAEIAAAVAAPSAATIATQVWSNGTRTLTSFGTLVADTAAAVWAIATSTLTGAGTIGKFLLDRLDVVLSTRLASSGYTTPPTVGAIADQVWDEATSGHQTAGSTGKALSDAGVAGGLSASDIWNYVTRTLTAASAVTVVSPIDPVSQAITLCRGDDYHYSDPGRIISWTSNSWADLTGSTCKMVVRAGGPQATLTVGVTVVTPTGTAVVRLDPVTAAQTSRLSPGPYRYTVQAVLSNGRQVTLARGSLTVLED